MEFFDTIRPGRKRECLYLFSVGVGIGALLLLLTLFNVGCLKDLPAMVVYMLNYMNIGTFWTSGLLLVFTMFGIIAFIDFILSVVYILRL